MYNVVKVNLNPNEHLHNQENISYLLVDEHNIPITSVCKFLKYLSSSSLSSSTIKNYAYNLKIYFEYLEEININYLDASPTLVIEFAYYLNDVRNKSYKSIKSSVNAISKFYKFLDFTCETSSNFSRISDLKNVIKNINFNNNNYEYKKKEKIFLTSSHIHRLCSFVSNDRDEILIKSLYETGARGHEILCLSTNDIVELPPNKSYEYGLKLHSYKKNTFERVVPISNELAQLIFNYIDNTLCPLMRENNLIFVHLKGSKVGSPLSYSYISSLIRSLKIKSNIDISLNTLRYSAIMNMLSKFNDISTTQLAYLAGLKSHVSIYNYFNNFPPDFIYEQYLYNKFSYLKPD